MWSLLFKNILPFDRTHKATPDMNRITVDYDMVYLGDGDIQVKINFAYVLTL
jgi:hypothetical protein